MYTYIILYIFIYNIYIYNIIYKYDILSLYKINKRDILYIYIISIISILCGEVSVGSLAKRSLSQAPSEHCSELQSPSSNIDVTKMIKHVYFLVLGLSQKHSWVSIGHLNHHKHELGWPVSQIASKVRHAANNIAPMQVAFMLFPAILARWVFGIPCKHKGGAPHKRPCSAVTGRMWDDSSSSGSRNRLASWGRRRLTSPSG